jgi:hypothetical protein
MNGAALVTASCSRDGAERQPGPVLGTGHAGVSAAHRQIPQRARARAATARRRRLVLTSSGLALLLSCAAAGVATADSAVPVKPASAAGVQQATATTPALPDPSLAEVLRQQQMMIEEQARQLKEQSRILAKQQEVLRQQQQQINALQQQPEDGNVRPATLWTPNKQSGGKWMWETQDVVPVPPTDEGQPEPQPPQEQTEGEPDGQPGGQPQQPDAVGAAEEERPDSEKPTDQLLLERGAILLPPGTLQIEPSIEYTHVSANQIAISGFTIFDAIVIGNIEVDDLSRDIFTATGAVRYGIADRLQIEARVPYVYREDSEIFGFGTNNQADFSADNFGLGDVEASASYQLLIGDGVGIPDTIIRAHGRFPTGESPFDIESVDLGNNRHALEKPAIGTGFYGVGGGATFVWRVDPVVFFAGLDATINLPRTFTATGEIDPGDTYQVFGGVNVQLSELVSLNLSFVDQYTTESEQNGIELIGSDLNDARLVLGTAVGVAQNASLTFNASAGLTKESPDFQFTVSLPISFSLF